MKRLALVWWIAISPRLALASPHYFAVHVDHLAPAKVKQFEEARQTFLQALRLKRLSDGRGFFWQGPAAFWTFGGFESFGELDVQKKARAQTLKAMDPLAQARYDRSSDDSLVPPHVSEIWVHEESLDYQPAGSSISLESAGAAKMIVEQIRPSPERGDEQYGETWKTIRLALAQAKYPLARVTYFSVYGSGKLVSFWLSPSPRELSQAPSLEGALAGALGSTKAREQMARLTECVLSSEPIEMLRRPDLDSPK